MWDTLEVTQEGTTRINKSRLNALTHEYKPFKMKLGEKMYDIQK